MIDLDTILNGACLKEVFMSLVFFVPLFYKFIYKTQLKSAKEVIDEKKEEIKRLQALVDKRTDQLINKDNV